MAERGFTVFEVLVTIAVFVLVILAAVPSIRTAQQNSTLRREGRTLLADLRLAQQLTVGGQTTHLIKLINTSPHKYQLIARTASDEVIKEHVLNSKVSWQDVGPFSNNEVIFTLSGSVVEPGTIILQNMSGLTISLEVKPSGYVKIN